MLHCYFTKVSLVVCDQCAVHPDVLNLGNLHFVRKFRFHLKCLHTEVEKVASATGCFFD